MTFSSGIGHVVTDASKPRLLDQVRVRVRLRHYSLPTEQAYIHWIRRFILYHDKRHPVSMGKEEITGFLSHLALDRRVSASTQNQALNALLFLYEQVLGFRRAMVSRGGSREAASSIAGIGARKPIFVGIDYHQAGV
jgi:hypothetical protein